MRIPDLVPRCVAFVMYHRKGADTSRVETLSVAGTAFLVQQPLVVQPKRAVQYMVTARHVIANIQLDSADGTFYIRCNIKGRDEVAHVQTHVGSWFFHPTDSSVDVAVIPWVPVHDEMGREHLQLLPIGTHDLFASAKVLAEKQIGIGDTVVVTGLFSRFVGNQRNLPVARIGTIALMPGEPVPTKKFGNIEAFLIELRSTGGLSGSPVFVYDYGPRLANPSGQGPVVYGGGAIFHLLGLLHGHWETAEDPTTSAIFGAEKLNLGIGVVVPAENIITVLEQPKLVALRDEVARGGQAHIPMPDR